MRLKVSVLDSFRDWESESESERGVEVEVA